LRIGVELVILFCDTSALMKLLLDEALSMVEINQQ